jgi:uncharacterized protein
LGPGEELDIPVGIHMDQTVWPGIIEPSIEAIERAPFLSHAQKRDILYNNAARFLRLTPQQIARHRAM